MVINCHKSGTLHNIFTCLASGMWWVPHFGHSSQIHEIHVKSKVLKSLKYSPLDNLIENRKFPKFQLHSSSGSDFMAILKLVSAIFHYFIFHKYISSLFRTKYIEKKFNLQLFFFLLFHKDLISLGLPCTTHLLETSCLEKITVCVIEAMLVTLPLYRWIKDEEKGTEQTKYKPR